MNREFSQDERFSLDVAANACNHGYNTAALVTCGDH